MFLTERKSSEKKSEPIAFENDVLDTGKIKEFSYQIPLSPYARVFYDEWLLNPQSYRYNMVCADCLLKGTLDVQRLRLALKRYVADHLLLNSHIQLINAVPYFIKNKKIDLLEYSESIVSDKDLFDFVTAPFDLHCGSLYRFKLIKISDMTYRFIVVFHHLVMDGVSLSNGLFKKVSAYYNDPNYTETISLYEQIDKLDTFQEKCYEDLQNNKSVFRQFWQEQLDNLEPLDLRFLMSSEVTEEFFLEDVINPIREIYFELEPKLINILEAIKARYQISSYFFSQFIFALVLHRYTQQTDFAISYPVVIKPGVDFLFGAQVNIALMPYRFNPEICPCDLLEQLKAKLNKIKKHPGKYSYYPVSKVIRDNQCISLLAGCFAQTSFRKTLFKFEGIASVEALHGLGVDGVTSEMLLMENDPEHINHYRVRFNIKTMDKEFIKSFISCYKKLFLEVSEDLLQDLSKPIVDYSLLTNSQTQAILALGQAPSIEQAPDKLTIHGVFEERVREFPNHAAVVFQDHQLSYRMLNEKANQLAHYLVLQYHIQPDERVMVCVEKSEWLVISILAVLKSSGAYVPIENYPIDRIEYIIKDAAPKCIIVSQNYAFKFKDKLNVIVLDAPDFQQALSQQRINNLQREVLGHHLSYIIYTSGTTGKPKGVLQQHNNVIDLFRGMDSIYHLDDRNVWTLFHSCVFDFSVWELFGALLHGAKLIIPGIQEIKDPKLFYQLCREKKVTILNQTPTEFYYFVHYSINNSNERLPYLSYIFLGGEALSFNVLSKWFEYYGEEKPNIVNLYGISETTVITTHKAINSDDVRKYRLKASLIGQPIPGKNVYVLDKQKFPVPIGAIGELYSTGGTTRGYLNQPETSQRCFIPNCFEETDKHSVLYKSGDLVRMLPADGLEYIGRIDNQIKIHAHRIELCEIDSVLMKHPKLKWAMTIIKLQENNNLNQKDCDKYLVSYFIATETINNKELNEYIRSKLPDFMLPKTFVQISHLPVTTSGKVDLRALPEPCFQNHKQHIPPSNEMEKIVSEAFCEVLKLDNVSIDDDFLALGGKSFDTVQLVLMLKEHLSIEVSDIFKLRTPRNIVKNVPPAKDILVSRLEKVKSYFKEKPKEPQRWMQKKQEKYLDKVKKINLCQFSLKPIKTVLLTGATGYLGCSILYQLLKTTEYTIILLIRASNSEEAISRISHKLKAYFNTSIDDYPSSRILCFDSDLEKDKLGLSDYNYRLLVSSVDSIIHSAALVKHYGNEEQFYSANVGATENLLKLASLTRLKDFHYISTCSVAQFGDLSLKSDRFFTEYDGIESNQNYGNVYNKTKFLGEQKVIQFRDYKVKSNIYRVGNLAFLSDSSKTQENIVENAFANWLAFAMKIKCFPREISDVCLSQTDSVAKAILLLFDKEQLLNETFHVFNPYRINLLELFHKAKFNVKEISLSIFVDRLLDYLKENRECVLSRMFLLHQGWVGYKNVFDKNIIDIAQAKTETILHRLNFKWIKPDDRCLQKYLTFIKQLSVGE